MDARHSHCDYHCCVHVDDTVDVDGISVFLFLLDTRQNIPKEAAVDTSTIDGTDLSQCPFVDYCHSQ
jgi:hypothetical protein